MSQCILCYRSAQQCEQSQPTNVFCNESCQQFHYALIGGRKKQKTEEEDHTLKLYAHLLQYMALNHFTIEDIVSIAQVNKRFADIFGTRDFKIYYTTHKVAEVDTYLRNHINDYNDQTQEWMIAFLSVANADDFDFSAHLYWASKFGLVDLVKIIIKKPRLDTRMALTRAILNQNIEIVKILLEDPRTNIDDINVMDAIRSGLLKLVRALYESGREIEPRQEYLKYALPHEHIFRYLLHYIEPDNSVFILAAKKGHVEPIITLLKRGFHDPYAIVAAARNRRRGVMKELLYNNWYRRHLTQEEFRKYSNMVSDKSFFI